MPSASRRILGRVRLIRVREGGHGHQRGPLAGFPERLGPGGFLEKLDLVLGAIGPGFQLPERLADRAVAPGAKGLAALPTERADPFSVTSASRAKTRRGGMIGVSGCVVHASGGPGGLRHDRRAIADGCHPKPRGRIRVVGRLAWQGGSRVNPPPLAHSPARGEGTFLTPSPPRGRGPGGGGPRATRDPGLVHSSDPSARVIVVIFGGWELSGEVVVKILVCFG